MIHLSHIGIRTPLFLLFFVMIMLGYTCTLSAAQRYEYVWSPEGLYRGTHPESKNPWSTKWVNNDDGSKSIEVTITRGTGYYNYIVIPRHYLKTDATDFTVEVTFRVTQSTTLPRTFYIFARNSKSHAYDIWQRWVGEPDGKQRTIRFPMQLTPVEGGKWTIYAGAQGMCSIIYDRIAIKQGRDIEHLKPQVDADFKASVLLKTTTLATGFSPIQIIRPDDNGQGKVISAKGRMIPDGDQPVSDDVAENNGKEIQRMINEAKRIPGNKTILIPKGVYRIANHGGVIADGVDDLTIDGQDSEFIYQRLHGGQLFMISRCNRMVVKNLNIDWNWDYYPIASMFRVKGVSDDRRTLELDFYAYNDEQVKRLEKLDWMMFLPLQTDTLYPKRDGQPEKFTLSHQRPTLQIKGNQVTAQYRNPVALTPGQTYAVRHLYYNLIAFKLANCSHLTFDGVTIYSMPGMGWLNTGTTHHWRFNNCKIVRRPGSKHPLTTAADGIHAGESKGDLIIENCVFTGMGDDCINLHDNTWQGGLEYGDNDRQLRLLNCPKHRLRIEPGDVLRFYQPDFSPAGVELEVADEPEYDGKPNAYVNSTITTINFTKPIPKGLSYLSIVANTRFGTHNVLIANNKFYRAFGRGILHSGNDVTVKGNHFEELGGSAIQVQADIVDLHWAEGTGTRNMVIANNKFIDVNRSGRWEGAVVYTGGRLPWGPTDYPLFDQFLIENNHFINSPGPAMTLTTTHNAVIRNNVIEMINPMPNTTPYAGTVFNVHTSNINVIQNLWRYHDKPEHMSGVIYNPTESQQVHSLQNQLQIKN